jgi:Tfp pilus assembly protein PilF
MLSERFGYRITVGDLLVEADLLMFGHRFLEREKPQEAVKLFEYAVTMNPDSWGALHGLAEAHMKDGQEGLASELYKRLLKLNPENEYAAEKLRQLE